MHQHYRPVIGVHKWFARRPGTLFRALALAELHPERTDAAVIRGHQLDGVCLDPFMGGGTPLVEASRLGLAVVGYDTNPLARWVVERELEPVASDQFADAAERVAAAAERRVGRYYRTTCASCRQDARVRYFLWVRHHRCGCGEEHALLADTLVASTGLGRHPFDVHICPVCLSLAEHPAGRPVDRCPTCEEHYEEHLVPPDTLLACGCGETYRIPPAGQVETPWHRLAGVVYHCDACAAGYPPGRRFFKGADEADEDRARRAARAARRRPSPFWPPADELIPVSTETRRLLRWGYNAWRDLFGERQLHGLGVLASLIAAEPDGPVKAALATCLSDLLRYQNVLCRFDRQALKPTDVFAVHGFPVPRVFCEPHLLGQAGLGSGGFRHIAAKYVRAKRWCAAPYETVPDRTGRLRRHRTSPEHVAARAVPAPAGPGTATLRCASMREGDLPDGSVDLVLTDPPYFANVQYAALADFSYTWLRRLVPGSPYFRAVTTRTDEDAVGGGNVDLAEFANRLSGVFRAAARSLKPGGPFCFTYHHNDLAAYAPVVMACLDAGLVAVRAYACPTEMRASQHIHGRQASTVDAVFMLRKPPLPAGSQPEAFGSGWVGARMRALRRAGAAVSDADRACLRHAAAALRAIAGLASSWDATAPAPERFAAALHALGLPAPAPAPVAAA